MEIVNGWTGADACALQSALRMSNVRFAAHLDVTPRTVADWHSDPGKRPRPDTQQLLDDAYKLASPEVRRRFDALTGQIPPAGGGDAVADAPGPGPAGVGVNYGVVSTGAGAVIDARTIHLPVEAVRAPTVIAAAPGLHNLPAPPNPVFVDRATVLGHLDEVIGQDPPASPPVVHGLGGTGKSTLALQFAHRNRDRYNPIWWIAADSPASVTTGLAELAARLNPYADVVGQTSAEAAAWAVGWLQAHPGWLLVLDDADSPADIAPMLGTLSGGRHLITTRRATGWHRVARPLELSPLPADAAADMLMQITNAGDRDRADAETLAAELGYLPLALEQAAAYIERTAISPADYLARLRRYPARMFAAFADADAAGESDRQRTIARIWQLSLAAIARQQPLAAEILRTLAWFAPDPIPRDLAYRLHDDEPLDVDDALGLLAAYSMITLTARSVSIHRLVQAVARVPDPADPNRAADAISRARHRGERLLLESLPESPLFNVPGWPRWRELLPHALAIAAHVTPDQDTPDTAAILLAASGFLQGDGHHPQAITAASRAAADYQRMHGPDAPDTLTARSYLASAHRAAGDLTAATPLHERNLADTERVLGADHPDTLVARANLAYLYALQGQPALARDLHQRNLADHERVNGPDHPHTLNARANLASAYRDLGDLPRAIELHQQSAADCARIRPRPLRDHHRPQQPRLRLPTGRRPAPRHRSA